MRWGVVVFPGSNDDRDALRVAERQLGDEAVALWHKDRDLRGADVVLLPGGFSYGDYLLRRHGAVLAHHDRGRRPRVPAACPRRPIGFRSVRGRPAPGPSPEPLLELRATSSRSVSSADTPLPGLSRRRGARAADHTERDATSTRAAASSSRVASSSATR
jgi:hypothetical protein